jgi:tetratricopeptide (TPR) repeat protein
MPMKRLATISFFLLLAVLTPTHAENGEAGVVELTSSQQAFLNLAEEERVKFADFVNEAMRLFQQKRIFEALEQIHEAKRIFDGSPELMNLEASCYVEIRNFDRALEIYLTAEELSPNNPSIKFNIAEVYFVRKEWEKSQQRFSALLTQIPENNIALSRLVEFKIMLTMLRTGREDEAFILANKYDFLDDSPFYYYAQAALAFEADDVLKAEEWLGISARIFRDPGILAPWQDTLVEFGHIKGFFGEDDAAGE